MECINKMILNNRAYPTDIANLSQLTSTELYQVAQLQHAMMQRAYSSLDISRSIERDLMAASLISAGFVWFTDVNSGTSHLYRIAMNADIQQPICRKVNVSTNLSFHIADCQCTECFYQYRQMIIDPTYDPLKGSK